MTEISKPTVFILHDREHGNYSGIVGNMDLPAAFSVRSFTDTAPDVNRYNEGLSLEAFQTADYLVVQDSLLSPPTKAVLDVLNVTLFSGSVCTAYGSFDAEYKVTPMSLDECMGIVASDGRAPTYAEAVEQELVLTHPRMQRRIGNSEITETGN